ncbi:MAG: AI-2E family transporter [Eubacterium sp.]|nr:AI-2E family transporter [Eubacterium sp.]
MKAKIDKRFIEALLLILVFGVVLFICVNTKEAKKLVSYAITVLNPFIYGFCIAYVLNLFTNQFDFMLGKIKTKNGNAMSLKTTRIISIIVSLVVVIAVAVLTVVMIIPNLKNTFQKLYESAPALWQSFLDFLDELKVKQPKLASLITTVENSLDSLFEKLTNSVKNNLSDILSKALTGIKSVSNVVVNFAIGLVIAFPLLIHKELLKKEFNTILRRFLNPVAYKRTRYVLDLTNKKFQIFLKYNVIQAVITGAGTLLFMLVTNMPYKISITLLITVSQLIPIVGAIAGTVVAALLILPVSTFKAILFVVLCIIVQQLVEKLINPHLMGKELELPGILTFLAVILGGKQFGLIGLLCAVPTLSVVYDIYTIKLRPRLYSKDKNK